MNDMPSTAFDQVPANARPSGFYAETKSMTSIVSLNQRALVIGQRLAVGTVAAGEPVLIPGDGSEAAVYFGRGSNLARMVAVFR
ncbi:MAG: phage tail protein, partial [Alphaproteobacteria bacterium]|nr:phage tail protein [Alphaproteobacteria bacterium]